MVSIFAFTLGVHLGKKVGLKGSSAGGDTAPVSTVADPLPNRQELTEQGKGAPQAVDESLNQTLHDEVGRTGVKIEVPRQVELPSESRATSAGATSTVVSPDSKEAKAEPRDEKIPEAELASIPAALRPASEGEFTLQVGSHQTLDEARDQVDGIETLGFKPFLRAALVKGKGVWYRVFMGGFPSKESADKAGQRFQSQHVIESYVVTKNAD
jgi:cell division protein FtsN